MNDKQSAWLHRLQTRIVQESRFLPKRLFWVTLLLLGIYGLLLIRTEWRAQTSNTGLVAAALASKLQADYTVPDPATLAFAPLSLDLVQDKLRDEHPNLPDDELAALIETVIAAAQLPILVATPTPGLQQATMLQSARVITETRVPGTAPAQPLALLIPPAATQIPRALPTQPVVNEPATVVAPPPPTATTAAQVANIQRLATSSAWPTPIEVATTPAILPTVALPTAQPTMTAWATASFTAQPVPAANTVATATPGPTATATPWPTSTPFPSPTATFASPTATGSSAPTVNEPTATNTAITFLPVTATATSTPLPTNTTIPPVLFVPTATPSPTLPPIPTATFTLIPPVIGTPPAVHNVRARVEEDQVYLEWTPIESAGLVGYNIYRSHTQPVELGTLVNPEPLTSTAFVDKIMRDGSQNLYVVTAVNQLRQESLPSVAVTVNTPDLSPPAIPRNVALQLTGDRVQLSWQPNQEPDLAGYNIYRSIQLPIDRTLGALNGNTPLTQPSYQDTIVQNGQTYYYVFTAVDLAGNESLPSIEAQVPTINWGAVVP